MINNNQQVDYSFEDMLTVFNEKVKYYSNYGKCDQRNFQLVKLTLNGSLSIHNDLEYTLIDDGMLTKNKNDIGLQIKNNTSSKSYAKLVEKYNELKALIKYYDQTLIYYDKLTSVSNRQKQMIKYLEMKIIYSIIELKVSLGLNLDDISQFDIEQYSIVLAYDVNNQKYESLDFNKHINEETNVLTYTKM